MTGFFCIRCYGIFNPKDLKGDMKNPICKKCFSILEKEETQKSDYEVRNPKFFCIICKKMFEMKDLQDNLKYPICKSCVK